MVSWRQLHGLGVGRSVVRAQLRARRWRQHTDQVFCTTTGALTFEQRMWLGVLHAGGAAIVGGLTAAACHGLRHWPREEVTILVNNPHSFEPVAGVTYFRTRRPLRTMTARSELPLCLVEPAILLFAAHEPVQRTAHGAIAAVVQQRLTTTESLATWLDRLRPLRRSRQFRLLLADIAGGAHSLAEVDVRRACRRFRIVAPQGQRARRDRRGRLRYTDCEWRLPGGRTLVLEVDGAFHDDVIQAAEHRARNRRLTTLDRIVVQCSAYEIRHDPGAVMEDLIALGVPRLPKAS
jgi:hypothetical protein